MIVAQPQLCTLLRTDPHKHADSLLLKARLYETAKLISVVAYAAISACAMAVSLGVAWIPPLSLPVVIIGFIAFSATQFGAQYFSDRAKTTYQNEAFERSVCRHLDSLITDEQIDAKLTEMGIPADERPAIGLQSLRPLIARYFAWNEYVEGITRTVDQILNADDQQSAPDLESALTAVENRILPSVITQATLLQQIRQPYNDISTDEVGTFATDSLAQRLVDFTWSKPLTYFIFKDQDRQPLTIFQLASQQDENFGDRDIKRFQNLKFSATEIHRMLFARELAPLREEVV